MLNYARLVSLSLSMLCVSAACSRSDSSGEVAKQEASSSSAEGSDAAIGRVLAAVRAMSQPEPTVDYVAAEMEGVIKARTKSQALLHFDGYRVTFVTPGDRVTQITFQLIEAKPSVRQLSEALGTPSEIRKGFLYERASGSTRAKIQIVAHPVSMPADDGSLVRRIIVQGASTR